ncbi:MAG: lactate racemase domain-containing protein, partial [Eubacteriales bacterium]|nr:lactate racemase domain-containing protein [Eubacteriales bacterium]
MPIIIERPEAAISDQELREALQQTLSGRNLKKVLLLPPDLTRLHSGAGRITQLCYQLLSPDCQVDIMPALGTHDAMTEAECRLFFGPDIPWSSFIAHRWKTDVVRIGEVPADFIRTVSEGRIDEALQIEINRRLLDPQYDLILSIGQVVPHEVVGMANYSKNILVG